MIQELQAEALAHMHSYVQKMGRIRVLLADDHEVVRRHISNLLQDEPDIQIVAEAENGEQALDLARKINPEAILMDVEMSVLNGVEATRILSREMPHIRVIALSMHQEEEWVNAILKAGAVNYLSKCCPFSELVNALRECRTGFRKRRAVQNSTLAANVSAKHLHG